MFGVVVDPVTDKLVTNLERPGGTITGVTTYDPQQPRKQLELLKTVIPDLKRVAILGDRSVSEALLNANDKEARALGLEVTRLRIANPNPDIDGVLAQAKTENVGALVMLEEPAILIPPNAKRIVALATADRLPTIIGADWAEYGVLMAYGTSVVEGARRMAPYVDKILKGAKPGDLPVQAVTGHKLTVNVKTARQIGLTLPPELLKKADRVIE